MSKKLQYLLQRTVPELESHLFGLKVWAPFSEGPRHYPRVEALLKDIEAALEELKAPREAPAPCPPVPPTLLDQFAIAAMQGLLPRYPAGGAIDYDEVAYRANLMAKAMMDRRNKQKS